MTCGKSNSKKYFIDEEKQACRLKYIAEQVELFKIFGAFNTLPGYIQEQCKEDGYNYIASNRVYKSADKIRTTAEMIKSIKEQAGYPIDPK